MVEVIVQSRIPCLVEWGELTMLDKWSNIVVVGELPELLVVVALVTSQHLDGRYVSFDHQWCDLRIVFPCCRHMNIEHGVGRRIDQQRRLQLLDGEVRSLRVVR